MRIGYGGSPDSLNPGLGLLAEGYIMYELVYDTPITIDLDGNYVPELAEEWSVSDDGLTWTLDLVEGATFHDGTPLTAEDVKYSLELWRDHEDWAYLSAYGDVFRRIEAPDEQTVTITLTNPVGNFESRMVFMYVVPKAIWEEVEDPVAFDNAEMIGSGPFKLAEYRQGEFVRLEANDDYFGAPPNVDEVIFQTIQNADARVSALTTGQSGHDHRVPEDGGRHAAQRPQHHGRERRAPGAQPGRHLLQPGRTGAMPRGRRLQRPPGAA